MLMNVTKNIHAEIRLILKPLYKCNTRGVKMITLSQPSERSRVAETKRPAEVVETAGSLAMLFENGLMTMGQYDEFVTNNPFAVDYSMYSESGEASVAWGGFLSDFSNAVSTLGDMGGSFAGFSDGGSCGTSCGGFTSVC